MSGSLFLTPEPGRLWKEVDFVVWQGLSVAENFRRSRAPCAPALRRQSRLQTRRCPQAAGATSDTSPPTPPEAVPFPVLRW